MSFVVLEGKYSGKHGLDSPLVFEIEKIIG